MPFNLHSAFAPAGDQPEAIKQLTEGLLNGEKYQTLLGVTGSGKTFTMANVIKNVQKPTLIITHNKTLVAQLYGEFRQFFPENAVEYFVSYYDYYQPEAYMPVSDIYIEKDLSINEELDKLRLRATTSLLSGRRDIVIVASVSCITVWAILPIMKTVLFVLTRVKPFRVRGFYMHWSIRFIIELRWSSIVDPSGLRAILWTSICHTWILAIGLPFWR